MDSENKHIAEIVSSDLDLNIPMELTDEEMILHIADRVEQMLKGDPDLLMSYLYRLDVEEKRARDRVIAVGDCVKRRQLCPTSAQSRQRDR